MQKYWQRSLARKQQIVNSRISHHKPHPQPLRCCRCHFLAYDQVMEKKKACRVHPSDGCTRNSIFWTKGKIGTQEQLIVRSGRLSQRTTGSTKCATHDSGTTAMIKSSQESETDFFVRSESTTINIPYSPKRRAQSTQQRRNPPPPGSNHNRPSPSTTPISHLDVDFPGSRARAAHNPKVRLETGNFFAGEPLGERGALLLCSLHGEKPGQKK